MPRPTLEQYYNYLKEAPRTHGWGALLVYDRKKANLLLMQEHILRADRKAWIEPVSGEAQTENGKFSRLSNFTFGPPVLSFENSSIGSSMAALSMPVVGGKLTEWSREQGAQLPTLVGISHLDPLSAPRVKMNIKLNEGKGGVVDEDGRVYLDLSESSAYYFEVSQWEDLNIKLGELIEAQLKDRERGEQIWELNTLAPVESALNPTSFRVRTHSLGKAGTPVASTNQADLEEGAVIVGVAFNGATNGGFPGGDEDMPYLLPQRQSGDPYSLSVVLSDETWVKNVLNSLLDGLAGTAYVPSEVTYTKNSSGFYTEAKAGSIRYPEELFFWIVDLPLVRMRFRVSGDLGQLSFSFAPGKIDCTWRYKGRFEHGTYIEINLNGYWQGSYAPLDLDVSASCSFSTSMEDGVIVLTKGPVTVNGEWEYDPRGEYAEEAKRKFTLFKDYVEGRVGGVFERLAGRLEVVDLLRLNGLLFRNEQRSVADTFANPGDVTMLGELAPTLTAFAIDPIERTLIAGGTQPLTLTPKPHVVEWSVKALPDDPEKPEGPEQLGEIVNDVYKAPKADTIAGTFRQVIITATVDDTSSSALFTVVPKSVAVRPMLLNAFYSNPGQPQRYVLEGGSVDSELVWAKGASFKGELRDPTTGEYDELKIPRDKQVKVYVAPLSDPETGPVLGALMQLDQVQVTGGNRTETIDITVLWTTTSATLKVEAQAGGALKLVLAVRSWGGGEQDLSPDETKWFVVKGKGALDEGAGIYSPGSEEGDYVIIAGVGIQSGNWNYAVLPMPYTSEEAQTFHEVNQAINGTNASAPYTAEQIEAMEVVKKAFSSLSAART
ncbi:MULTISPECIES: hypothetical protein [Pseudomonas]|uniref:Uncharacterized protein n=1 Tax=Pseudomonas putida TaxID=303 RepID=A0A7W2L165_PSEPU|nr:MULTISPECIES: hypothetical protein [Pseudomonas]MBA6116603.1 hypothetical protein [Pseudomonas putida]QNL90025.1 Uncharacterized protein PPKH_4611 [Pseudomonas putida]